MKALANPHKVETETLAELGAIWGSGAVFGRFERNRRLEFTRKLVTSRLSENRVKSRRLHHSTHLTLRLRRTVRFARGKPPSGRVP